MGDGGIAKGGSCQSTKLTLGPAARARTSLTAGKLPHEEHASTLAVTLSAPYASDGLGSRIARPRPRAIEHLRRARRQLPGRAEAAARELPHQRCVRATKASELAS